MVEFLLHNTLGAWWAGKRKYESCLSGCCTRINSFQQRRSPGCSHVPSYRPA
jgi:hypothetical protein